MWARAMPCVACTPKCSVLWLERRRRDGGGSGAKKRGEDKAAASYDMVVVRVSSDGRDLLNSRPCSECIVLLRLFCVRNVFYSTGDERVIACERVKDMVDGRVTTGTRFARSLIK